MIKQEQNPKLGAYYVGTYSRPIYNKLHALEFSIKTNQAVRWEFNEGAYSKIDWLNEPATDLNTLYLMRARQLRERYDYLILQYSGGADSTNILYTFLKNGIHIDEIVVHHPESALKNVSTHAATADVTNTISEFDYAVRPRLQWVRDNFPQVKITIHDYFDSMVNSDLDESWIYTAREFFHPGMLTRFSMLSLDEQKAQYEKGRKTAVIYGIDKPRLHYIDGKYFVYFADIVANTAVTEVGDYSNITTEFFYWTPDLPEITVKQAHLLKKWYELNPQFRDLIKPVTVIQGDKLAFIERSITVPVIYTNVDYQTFQASKPTNAVYSEHDSWFWNNHMNTRAAQIWKAGIDTLVKMLPKYLKLDDITGAPRGLTQFKSKLYQI